MKHSKKHKKLQKLYAKIPNANCKGLCAQACSFVMCSKFETKLIAEKHGDADLLQNPCPKLVNGRCSIYEDRPFVCRAFGVVPGLPCTFGCKPDSKLTAKQAYKIFHAIEEL